MSTSSLESNYIKLDEIIKLYPRVMLLLDEYSMISKALLDSMNDALIRTTQRSVVMGGIKTLFFGDVAQLPPVNASEGSIWESGIYNYASKFSLEVPIRQVDQDLINVLNKVRMCVFDEEVIKYINARTFASSSLPPNCLRLYTTRENVQRANKKEFQELEGESMTISAVDIYGGGSKHGAIRALKETGLLKELQVKVNMPVMLIHNLRVSGGWVNGTLAKILEVDDENILLARYTSDEEETIWIQKISRTVPGTSYVRTQFPIVPVFATTIHKAQSHYHQFCWHSS